MGRGGIGARKRLAERVAQSTRYALTGVARGSRVALCLDKYGRWELGYRLGTLRGRVGQTLIVVWDDGDDQGEGMNDGDARYLVDTNRMRIGAAAEKSVLDILSNKVETKIDRRLPSPTQHDRLSSSPMHKADANDRGSDMTTTETTSSSQLANQLGIDSKTLRRFLRSDRCTVTPVGAGGRYEFTADQVDQIHQQFMASSGKKKQPKTDTPKSKSPKARDAKQAIEADDGEDFDLELDLEGWDDLSDIDEAHL